MTETEQKLMESVKLFETDEEYLKHIKEKENGIMSKASTNVTTSTAVATTSTTTSTPPPDWVFPTNIPFSTVTST